MTSCGCQHAFWGQLDACCFSAHLLPTHWCQGSPGVLAFIWTSEPGEEEAAVGCAADNETPGMGDALLIGNGPLLQKHRAVIRAAFPDQVFRFNGMNNMHPNEPVGTVFARVNSMDTEPWGFWGLSHRARKNNMCHRINESRSVILLGGRRQDVDAYESMYPSLHVDTMEVETACAGNFGDSAHWVCKASDSNVTHKRYKVVFDGQLLVSPRETKHGWSSGFFGLSFVMHHLGSASRVHVFGMNWNASVNDEARFDHPFALEKRLVLNLTKRGIVAMHCTDPGRYRSPSPDGKWSQDGGCGEWHSVHRPTSWQRFRGRIVVDGALLLTLAVGLCVCYGRSGLVHMRDERDPVELDGRSPKVHL